MAYFGLYVAKKGKCWSISDRDGDSALIPIGVLFSKPKGTMASLLHFLFGPFILTIGWYRKEANESRP
jgi:hypothetical protein